jgi:lysozyme
VSAKVVGVAAAAVLALAGGFVATWEGYEPKPYQDIVGVWTVCYGHTGNVEQRTYTRAECEALLQSDLGKQWNGLSNCIRRPLKDHETAAVLSLAFSVGYPAVCKSTMVRKINAGAAPAEFCRELFKWVYAGGKKVRGLERRRASEFRLCMNYPQ